MGPFPTSQCGSRTWLRGRRLAARLLSLLVVVPVRGKLRGQDPTNGWVWLPPANLASVGERRGVGGWDGHDVVNWKLGSGRGREGRNTNREDTRPLRSCLRVMGGRVDCDPAAAVSRQRPFSPFACSCPLFSSFRGGVAVVLITPDKSTVRCPIHPPVAVLTPCPALPGERCGVKTG